MAPKWKNHPTVTPGLLSASIELSPGCTVDVANFIDRNEQKAQLKMQLNGVNYSKTFTRPIPEDDTLDAAEKWAFDEVLQHVDVLCDLAGKVLDGITEKAANP